MSFWRFLFGLYIFDAIFGGRSHRDCDDNSILNPFPPNDNDPSRHNDDYSFGDGYDWHDSLGTGLSSTGYDWHDSLGTGHSNGGFDWGSGSCPPPYDPFDDDFDDDY